MDTTRRQMLAGLSLAGAGALLAGCQTPSNRAGGATNEEGAPAPGEATPVVVTATEDLMRDHGILRRALLVYQESAVRLRQDAASIPTEALEKVVTLVRVFGEDYHERRLEEAYILPSIKNSQGPAAAYADVLLVQHARGREITDYLLAASKEDRITAGNKDAVVKALESFARMYQHHAAIEDTIVFPAWKSASSETELDELGAKFEEIEVELFGEDGFEQALKRIAEIETSLGMANLETFTAPPP